MSIGAQFTPAQSPFIQAAYWKKVQYRIGVKYYPTYLQLQNTPLSEYSVAFGVGLPVGKMKILQQYSVLNFSFELGKRGTIANNLIKEQFAKITVGFTINDRWFIKSKID